MAKTFKIGIFDEEEKFVSSVKVLQEQKYSIYEVFTPYPVNEVLHLLKRKTRLPTAAFFFGLFGIISSLAFLYYTSVISWPVDYGGKPFNSFPSFIVVTIGTLGNIIGGFFGGLILGCMETVGALVVGSAYKDTLVYVCFVVILVVKQRIQATRRA